MRSKYFLVTLFLILAIFLTGCGITSVNDEAKIKSVIQDWRLAINAQSWNEALSYCVYGSEAYYFVYQLRDEVNSLDQYCSVVTINFSITDMQVSIYGNYAEVSCYGYFLITGCGVTEGGSWYAVNYLQKIGNNWKLYQSSVMRGCQRDTNYILGDLDIFQFLYPDRCPVPWLFQYFSGGLKPSANVNPCHQA